jgi:hypothetical protein
MAHLIFQAMSVRLDVTQFQQMLIHREVSSVAVRRTVTRKRVTQIVTVTLKLPLENDHTFE